MEEKFENEENKICCESVGKPSSGQAVLGRNWAKRIFPVPTVVPKAALGDATTGMWLCPSSSVNLGPDLASRTFPRQPRETLGREQRSKPRK